MLPEFQREYVWGKDQAKKLMVSLFKGYPIGSLLFWKTEKPPELKNIKHLPEILGTFDVILDGQQRLTTLYMIIFGEIPPYYREVDIETDPRDLFFNIDSSDFQYYQPTLMKGNRTWIKVTDCFSRTDINVFEIAHELAKGDDKEAFILASKYNSNLTQLKNILNIDLPTLTVPSSASLEEAIDIFDRVNSLGTKLTDAELALTHVTGKWAQARKVMKAKIIELKSKNFEFDLNFMTRALTVVVTNRALFETIHSQESIALQDGWRTLSKILDYLISVLPTQAFIHSVSDLNSSNVLIPWVAYLALHGGKFPNSKEMYRAIHWLYSAHIWTRYTSQTDQRLEQDVSIVSREPSPWSALLNQIIDQRGRIEVKASDLEGRGIEHPLYRMALIVSKAQGAFDWFNGVSLTAVHGKAYAIQSHHIFPQAILYKGKFDSENHLHRKIVNEIANRAFLTAESNLEISSQPPSRYLPDVEAHYPGALVKQFIPMDTHIWQIDRYEDFLSTRRELIAKKINEFLNALIGEPEILHQHSVQELIQLGESATLEFKSTFQWDMIQGKKNEELRLATLKTIAAFLNSGGGTLVIGVEDTGSVCGIGSDLELCHGTRDGFQQLLASLIAHHIGPAYSPVIQIRFEHIGDMEVCVIDVDHAQEPVFLKTSKGSEFFIRLASTSRNLDAEETHTYISLNWS